MYKILVVDDEKWIRKGIIKILNSVNLEFTIIEAEDGREAFEIIRKSTPDIVLLDIRMPYFDGINVIKKIQKFNRVPQIVVISGYPEFNYVQEVLNHGALGYILKPIDPIKLTALLTKAIKNVDQRDHIINLSEEVTIAREYDKYLHLEKTINHIFNRQYMIDKNEKTRVNDKFSIEHKKIILGVMYAKNTNIHEKSKTSVNLLNEIIGDFNKNDVIYAFENYNNESIVHILIEGDDDEHLMNEASFFIDSVFPELKIKLKHKIMIILSLTVDKVDSNLCERLSFLLDYRFITEYSQIIFENEFVEEPVFMLSEDTNKLLIFMLKKKYNIKKFLNSMFININISDKIVITNIRQMYINVMQAFIEFCFKNNIDTQKHINEIDLTGETVTFLDSREEIVNYLYTTFANILDCNLHDGLSCSEIVENIKNYIDNNYEKKLTLKDLSYQFAVNPSYLSNQFKQVTGKNFIEYVNAKKINAAGKQILHTNISITKIANGLGFNDISYFYKLFKRIMKKTPLEYRRDFIS